MNSSTTDREEEVVAELEHRLLEAVASPHHLEVVLAHEHLLGSVVDAIGGAEEVAVAVDGLAALVGGGVHGDDDEVVQEARHAALPGAEALEEEVEQGARARPRRVDLRHDHRPVLGRRARQHLLQVAPRRRGLQISQSSSQFTVAAFYWVKSCSRINQFKYLTNSIIKCARCTSTDTK